MLHKVTVENFFSIAEEQLISFVVPANAPDLPCFSSAKADQELRLAKVVGFFGNNASGKSTILRAITTAVAFALNSFDAGSTLIQFFQPYRQEVWWTKPTKILIEFDGRLASQQSFAKFRYELHIAHQTNKLASNSILYEALTYAPKGKFKRLFERHAQSFSFGEAFDVRDEMKQYIRPDASVLSTLVKLNHAQSIYLFYSFIGLMQDNILSLGRIQQNNFLSIYAADPSCLERLNLALRRLDIGLESMTIESGPNGFFAKLKHVGLDDFVFFQEESTGTQRFIEIFPRLHYALEFGSIAIIDELDVHFHPLLLPELFRWFCDSERNPRGAQLLFTAHNPAVFDYLEKEQLFLVTKPSGQATQIYCAKDIKGLRRAPSLMKKYLSGELGAVPHIG